MMCGDGETKQDIINICNENDILDNIIFVNQCNDIYKYYNAFDIFILPSKYEGLGMVLIEAQYNGIQCLASNTVPREVIISNKIEFIDLNENVWVNKIKSYKKLNHIAKYNNQKDVFDIRNQIIMISKIYKNQY